MSTHLYANTDTGGQEAWYVSARVLMWELPWYQCVYPWLLIALLWLLDARMRHLVAEYRPVFREAAYATLTVGGHTDVVRKP